MNYITNCYIIFIEVVWNKIALPMLKFGYVLPQ